MSNSEEMINLVTRMNELIAVDDIHGLDQLVNGLDNYSIFYLSNAIESAIAKEFFISRYSPKLTVVE